jgi:L-fucose isomerase-like protein
MPYLAFFQLNNEGLLGVCEADLEATISQLIGQYLTQRAGFVSDPVIDSSSSQIIYAHCVAPNKPFGKVGSAFPYRIRSHAEDGKGASVQVSLPPGETLTTIKVNLLAKKMTIHQARSVGNIEDERACRTKLAAEADVEKILRNWDYQTFGWHRVTFYGDFREDFRNLATLLGLVILEEDK